MILNEDTLKDIAKRCEFNFELFESKIKLFTNHKNPLNSNWGVILIKKPHELKEEFLYRSFIEFVRIMNLRALYHKN